MSRFSKFISPILSRHKEDTYSVVSTDEPGDNTPLQSENDKDEPSNIASNANKEYRDLIKYLFIILSLLIVVTIASIGVVVSAIGNKCPMPPTMTTAPTVATTVPSSSHPFSNPQPEISTLTPKNCGKDPQTARERGCHFDVMSMIWIPHECYDPELTAEFASEKTWQWSLHENGTDLISEEDIRKGEIQHGWVQFEYHITHCLYTWKKLNKQVERGGAPIDGYVSNHTHTEHCSHMLSLRKIPAERWNTPFVVLYPTCYV